MADTTSILDLPTDPTGGGSIGGNISFSANETNSAQTQDMPSANNGSGVALDQTTINQIVSGLQQASVAGMTQLQSRDIPIQSSTITQDAQVQPNYIPQPHPTKEDYIQNHEDNDIIMRNYDKKISISNKLDETYDEIQIPLLVIILYFLFQLPIFKRYLYKYAPALFSKDGNINIYGLIFMSITFGIFYYILSKTIRNMS